jgi:type IV pilus assembly protein PilF
MIANDAKAKGYFIKALQHNPNMLTSLEEMARLTDKAGDYPAAREYLNRYVNLNPSSKNVLELGINIAKQLHDKTMLAQYENLLKKSLSNTATNAKN